MLECSDKRGRITPIFKYCGNIYFRVRNITSIFKILIDFFINNRRGNSFLNLNSNMGFSFNTRILIYVEISRDDLDNIDKNDTVYDYINELSEGNFIIIPGNIDDHDCEIIRAVDIINGDISDDSSDDSSDDDSDDDSCHDVNHAIVILQDVELSCYKGRREADGGCFNLDNLKKLGIKNPGELLIYHEIEGGLSS